MRSKKNYSPTSQNFLPNYKCKKYILKYNSENMYGREAVVVVDYQNDFAHKEGTLYVPGWETILQYINDLIIDVKSRCGLVISTQDWHPENHTSFAKNHNIEEYTQLNGEWKWPVHCVQDTWGSEFLEGLDTKNIDRKIIKWFEKEKECYSWFGGKEIETGKTLQEILQEEKIKILHIVWLATDYCVHATTLNATETGKFDVYVHTQWIKGVNANPNNSTIAIMWMHASWAIILS